LQAKGTLADTDLRSLLESAQSERATGTLTLRDGSGRSATFYFLFGHLFHALADGKTGDDAVVGALAWGSGEFDFDPKAKLPADETVRSSIPDLIENAGSAPPPRPAAESSPPAEPAQPTAQAASPEHNSEPAHTAEDALSAQNRDEPQTPAPEPPTLTPFRPTEQPVTPAIAPTSGTPQPRRGVKHRPQPRHGRDPIPVPSGQLIYDSLKTSFVDFPRLITTLEREGYTGYVKLLTEEANGLIFFRDGAALECVLDRDTEAPQLGTPALRAFHQEVTHGHGVLDVVQLNGDLVEGLHDLTVARPIYSDLYASWIDAPALLGFLSEKGLSGSLMVRSEGGVGVVILSGGRLAGAYTTDAKEVADSPDAVLALCQDPHAVIEVKANEGRSHEKLDVDSVIGANRSLEGGETVSPPAPAAPAASAPASAVPAVAATVPPAPALPSTPPNPGPAASAAGQPESGSGPSATDEASRNAQGAPAAVPSGSTLPNPVPAVRAEHTAPTLPVQPAYAPGAVAAPPRVPPDWDLVVADLQASTEEALGNRSRKVKDVLASAERSQLGIEAAINQIPTISILFVDSSRLEALAADLRGKLNSYLQ
jgi:hypothetical protein